MPKHILIVDDSKTVRNLVAFIMRKEGFKVTAAEDDTVWLFLHSGSRGVGNKLAQKHIAIARTLCEKWWIDCPTGIWPTSSKTPRSSGPLSATCAGPSTTPS